MSLQFRSHYWDDSDARTEYIRFTREIHGLDLSAWHDHGYWDDDYVPFSFFLDGRIVSNVAIYLLPMVVAGRRSVVPQVSTVGTDPGHRRRGLNRELTETALAWCRDRTTPFSFLFADEDAFPFYRKCGYRPIQQHRFTIEAPTLRSNGLPRLLNVDARKDLDLLGELARTRTAVSDALGCLSINLFMFHVLYTLRDCAFWLEDLGTTVFARTSGSVLRILDIVGPRIPPFADVRRHLPAFDVDRVEFMFMPEKLDVEPMRRESREDTDGTHIGGTGFPYETLPFRFPFTAHA